MSNWLSGSVVANNFNFHYHRTGGDKPPLVLAHGITDNGLCWTRTAEALEKEYDLIMVDARGHGLSDAPETGYTPEDRAADLAGFIEALNLDRPYLMGHSMGADTIALTAAYYPHLVGCAILEDPPWYEGLVSEESRETSTGQWHANLLEQKSRTFEALVTAAREEHPQWSAIEFGAWAQAKLQVSPDVLRVIRELRPHWRETVAKITCPTLLITGDPKLGGLVTSEVAAEVARLCPHVSLAPIAGAGHSVRREQFEQFINIVTVFLAGM
ncbi:MAG: alpha/beta hydrolase [Anaerolineae bacterium]|nr:alpha/beta hydrolase [Anaerolineae bacterium]